MDTHYLIGVYIPGDSQNGKRMSLIPGIMGNTGSRYPWGASIQLFGAQKVSTYLLMWIPVACYLVLWCMSFRFLGCMCNVDSVKIRRDPGRDGVWM